MEVDPTRAPERLKVLRGEVGRLHEVLAQFLTFSRPLTPLALESIDLRALFMDVVDLHAGLA